MAGNYYPDSPHSQRGMKFSNTQISPLLNYILSFGCMLLPGQGLFEYSRYLWFKLICFYCGLNNSGAVCKWECVVYKFFNVGKLISIKMGGCYNNMCLFYRSFLNQSSRIDLIAALVKHSGEILPNLLN